MGPTATITEALATAAPAKALKGRKDGAPSHHATMRSDPTKTPDDYLIQAKPLFGRVTRWARSRVYGVYIGLAIIGTVLFYKSEDDTTRTLGAGLVFPGAGFLALSPWFIPLFLLNVVLFPVSIFVWWLCGMVLATPTAIYGGALLAAKLQSNGSPREYAVWAGWIFNLLVYVAWTRRINQEQRDQDATRKARNVWIAEEVARVEKITDAAAQANLLGAHELTPEQIRHFRFLINLTRQPLNSWKGFTKKDQFREGAFRYQLYYMLYALSSVQCNVMPNFHGYLSEAQQIAIEKVLRPESLYYWAFESLWGRLSLRWDPVENENIMLTGWYLCGIAMYMSASGDERYMEPGSLVAQVTPLHKYRHSVPTLIQALVKNWKANPYCLYPCEPNWTYSSCNAYGVAGVQALDRIFKTNYWGSVEDRYRKSFHEEFMNPNGDACAFRSSIAGISVGCGGSARYNLGMTMQTAFPEFAKQQAAIFHKEFIHTDKETGKLSIKTGPEDHLDVGEYKMHKNANVGRLWSFQAAKDLGDFEVAEMVEKELDASIELIDDGKGGVRAGEMSTLCAILFAWGKLAGFDFWRRTVMEGPPEHTKKGPLLAQVPYPDVIVAKAWSSNGLGLDAVFYDGEGPVTARIGLERLRPGQQYTVSGGNEFTADKEGKAEIEVFVSGRTPVRIEPRA